MLEIGVKSTEKEKIGKVTRALLGDTVPPPMNSPTGLASENVYVTLESGETLRAYFHSNGYCYAVGAPKREDTGIFRWEKDATTGYGATVEWREKRPWVASWSKDPPTTVLAPGSRRKFRTLQQIARPRLRAHPPPTPTLPGSPSRKALRAPRAAKRG